MNPHHPFIHLPRESFFECEGVRRRAPLVVPPLVEPVNHRYFQAVDFCSKAVVPGDLPLLPHPVLLAYFIVNCGRYRGTWVVARKTVKSRCHQKLQKSAGDVLNARVDCHRVVQFRIGQYLFFHVCLEGSLVRGGSLVQSTKSYTLGKEGSPRSPYPRHGE